MRERKLEKDLKRRRKKKSAEERGENLQDTVARGKPMCVSLSIYNLTYICKTYL